MSGGMRSSRATATDADRSMTPGELRAIVADVRVSGDVLHDLDALAQEHCDAIDLLADQALRRLALDPDALVAVRSLLRMVRDHAQRLGDAINEEAESHGCNYVDLATEAFCDGLRHVAPVAGVAP